MPKSLDTSRCKLLVLDLDGTLFGEDHIIRPAVHDAVIRAGRAGIRVVLATGRMVHSARPYAEELGLNSPLICYQGALIQEPDADHPLRHQPVSIDLARQVIDFAEARGVSLNVYVNDQAFSAERNADVTFYEQLNSVKVEIVGDLRVFLTQPTTKLVLICLQGAAELYQEMAGKFSDRLQVVQSHRNFAEVTDPDVSKGNAVAFLAKHFGIEREEIVAVGDQQNDRSMVEFAGIGVAMGSATLELKDAADLVAPTLAEDGVAWVIDRILGGK